MQPQQRKSILIADDDEDMRRFIGMTLDGLGYKITLVNDGEAALFLVNETVFDLLVLDIMMPKLHGLALLGALKTNSGTQEIPVIMVSSRQDAQTWAATVNLGAKQFLHKPFTAVQLATTVDKAIGPA